MKYLIYMSRSVQPFDKAELKDLLRKSQAYNIENQITGMLLYTVGSFVQVLEGNAEDVDTLFSMIEKDLRHKEVILLAKGPLSERMFPEWSMGYKFISADEFAKFDPFINPKKHSVWEKAGLHPATTMLRIFAENNKY